MDGTVTDGTVTEGTVTEGTVTDGTLTEGTVTEGTLTDGTVMAPLDNGSTPKIPSTTRASTRPETIKRRDIPI